MDDYYDLDSNRIFVRGFKDLKTIKTAEDDIVFKRLIFPAANSGIYLITQHGVVINNISNTIIPIKVDGKGYPIVLLSSSDIVEYNNKRYFFYDWYRIVDLVAYNFIRNSDCYLERGYIASNKDGNLSDNCYSNVVYLPRKGD